MFEIILHEYIRFAVYLFIDDYMIWKITTYFAKPLEFYKYIDVLSEPVFTLLNLFQKVSAQKPDNTCQL